jgi:hypothetical protein
VKNKRLNDIKRFIKITKHKSGHLFVVSKFKGCRFKRLTSIRSDLTAFELNAVFVHVYKLIAARIRTSNPKFIGSEVSHMNYAEVFGSPWELENWGTK